MTTRNEYNAPSNFGPLEPEDLFAPKHYEIVRNDGSKMRSLPLWCYTSERFHEAEKEHIFLRSWNLLEREETVPNVGDYYCLNVFDVPLLIVRGKDKKVRVFANTCRHRGALVATGSGNCKAFRCPYHFWTYTLDGAINGAPDYKDLEGQPLINDSNRHEFGLVEIDSGVWGGFIFIRFKEGNQTLKQHLGTFVAHLASHKLEDMVTTRKIVYDMDANWKCFVENYIDLYHIPYVHKNSLSRWKVKKFTVIKPTGEESLGFSHHDGSQLLLPFDGYNGFPAMPQVDVDKKRGTYFTTLRPNIMMTLGNDGALVFQSIPISAGKSSLVVSSLFPKNYLERDDFEKISENYYRRNELVVGEDKEIANRQYAGLKSPYARIARLGDNELRIRGYSNWIINQVIGKKDHLSVASG